MAFPTVAAETTSDETANTTTHTVDMPSGSGGTLLTILGFDARPIVSGQIPDNWASAANTAASGDQCALRAYTLPGGAGGASQTITTDAGQCSGHYTVRLDGAAAFESAVFQGTTGTSFDPPSLNPAGWDTEDTLWFAVSVNDDGTVTVTGFPTNYTNTGQVNAGDSADGVTLAWGRRALAAASEDPGAFTGSGTVPFCTALVAVRPVPLVGHVATGTKAGTGTTTQALAYPAGVSAGRLAIACRNAWQNLATTASESGWLNHTDLLGGLVGTNALDSHQGRVAVDTRELDGSESGSVTFDQGGTVNGVIGLIMLYEKLAGSTWDIAVVTGDDATHGANRSAAAGASVSLQPGDVVVAVAAVDTDTNLATFSAPAITASGITFGTTTRRTTGAGVGTGNDGNIEVFDATVTAGTGTTAPTLAFTTGTSQCGPVAFVRLRAVTAISLVVADAGQAQTADEVALTQVHSLVVADAAQGQSADVVALAQVHQLAVDDATHAHTADGVAVTESTDLVVADAAHAHTADQVALTQAHSLAVADSTHTTSADSPALTQAHSLVSADASHTHTADVVTLSQAHALIVADAAHAQAADSPALGQVHALAVADATHGHTADQVTITESGPADLAVNDAAHGHSADQVTLVQQHALTVADTAHGQTADVVALGQVHVLGIHDAHHGHTADTLAMGQVHELVVADATHAHEAGQVSLGQFSPDVPSQGDYSPGGGALVYEDGRALVYDGSGAGLVYDP